MVMPRSRCEVQSIIINYDKAIIDLDNDICHHGQTHECASLADCPIYRQLYHSR